MMENQKLINQTRFFKHVEFEKPLKIAMDGKNMKSAIVVNGDDH